MAGELTTWRSFRELAPFREFEKMRRGMDRFWDSFFERRPMKAEETREFLPALDLAETDNEFVVKCEVQGLEPKDIDISLSDGTVIIKGEKKQEREEKEENYHLIERNYGSFTRSIRLPVEVQSDKISASYQNGVLTVVLPKFEGDQKKQIKIKVE